MIVLSLFNGMGTGLEALLNVGIKIDAYYSSEIKPYAIELVKHHHPEVIQVGDVIKWKEWDIEWAKIDLLLSGSPCQDLSIAGNRAGINGNKSSLFWVFIDILNHIKSLNPNVLFLQENVGSAPKKDVGIMSRAMGLYPVRINSSLLTAQLRDRYYWTNIRTKPDGLFGDIVTDIPQPKDRKIMFKDIITDGEVGNDKSQALLMSEAKTYGYKDMDKFTALIARRSKENRQLPNMIFVKKNKANCVLESESRPHNSQDSLVIRDKKGFTNIVYSAAKRGRYNEDGKIEQQIEINETGKGNCLTTVSKDSLVLKNHTVRTLNKIELCRLQGFPDSYCDILTRNKAASLLGDGWTLPVIEHIFSYINK